jgi:ribosomal protein S27AE
MKFIQITSAGVANNHTTQCNWVLHALDDEGRIWELDDAHGWCEVPLPVPAAEPSAVPHVYDDGICIACGASILLAEHRCEDLAQQICTQCGGKKWLGDVPCSPPDPV